MTTGSCMRCGSPAKLPRSLCFDCHAQHPKLVWPKQCWNVLPPDGEVLDATDCCEWCMNSDLTPELMLVTIYDVRESLRRFEVEREETTIDTMRMMLDRALRLATPEQLAWAHKNSPSAILNDEVPPHRSTS